MSFTPHSVIRLLNTCLTADNENQLTFKNASEQAEYFASLTLFTFDDFTYQRKDNIIRVGINADELWQINYVMYRNENFSNKWFYAYVTDIVYVNDNCSYLSIKTDVFQTWIFSTTFYQSLIERKHVENDGYGLHTINEGLPVSDLITQNQTRINESDFSTTINMLGFPEFNQNYYIAVALSEFLADTSINDNKILPFYIGGLPTPIYLYSVSEISEIFGVFSKINSSGQGNAVISVFAIPKKYCYLYSECISGDKTLYPSLSIVMFYNEDMYDLATIPHPDNIQGYKPKNNKCLTYPYCCLELSNNNEAVNQLKFENTSNGQIGIKGVYCGGVNASYTAYPLNYEGVPNNYIKGVSFSNFPQIAWTYDAFKNYVALNKNQLQNSVTQTIVNSGVQMLSGNVLGGTLSAASNFYSMIANLEDKKNIPQSCMNLQQPESLMLLGGCGIYARIKTVRKEYAIMIDEYFNRYGYKVNEVETPKLKTRKNWNFIKTVSINLKCECPQQDIAELKSMFNNGVTLWHNPKTFGDYSQDNEVI